MTDSFSTQPQWLAGFALPADPSGAVIALDFGDAGLWAGRVEAGRVVGSETETRIRPEVLDARIAAYLRDTGAVDAGTPEAFGELVVVVGRGRHSLIGHDSSLTMGYEHLRLVRLGLDDVIEATVPEANRAHGMIVELAGAAPVDAVLLGPGHDAWPGLWEALTERGFSVLQPGDDFPEVFGGDDRPTDLLEPVAEAPAIRAWEDSGDHPALVDPADYGLDRFGNAASDASDGERLDDDGEGVAAEQPQGLRGRVVALGIVVMLAVGGGAVALALNAHESNGPELSSADSTAPTSKASATGQEPERVNISVDQGDLDAARAPMSQYTTPPPPPPPPKETAQRPTEAQPGPKPPAPTRHKTKTIPNPIPGLPPIVIG
ncbi:hypothetical protein [Gordonia phthalatica]|uniref:Uncharacterized protein n=1 Tax=Gordonia phthalatica TaxID=1136941 RepID=A0A0N9N6J8_9ACTN|nr:hypothetical protein [Gordonia phthalatica]ALG86165.1 hypothetical protein ACH46_18780 [Gordonia phthalatica]